MSNRGREGRGRGREEMAEILMRSPLRIAHEYWGLRRERGREKERGRGHRNLLCFFGTIVGVVYMSVVVSC